MKKNKLIWIIVGLLVVLIIAAVVFGGGKSESPKVTSEETSTATITEVVTANGKIQAADDVKISSDVSGEITELLVKEGQLVNEGDLLAKIKPDLYQAALSRAEASYNSSLAQAANSQARLNQAKAQFQNAEKVFKRQKELFAQRAISQAEYDQAIQTFEVAQAEVQAADQSFRSAEFSVRSSQAGRKEAADQLSRTLIYAPKGGTISNLQVQRGERVVGTAQMTGTEMMRISNMNEMEVHVDVNENDIIRVEKGDTALVEVDSYLNRKFKGVVTEIGNAAISSSAQVSTDQVINFRVKIRILTSSYADLTQGRDASYSPFRPGMSASVEIQTKTAANVVAVPIEAVTTRADSSASKGVAAKKTSDKTDDAAPEFECVFVLEGGKAKIRKVKTGIQDNKFIQITSGLKKGEKVITGPYSAVSRSLRDNMSVEVVSKDELFEKEDK